MARPIGSKNKFPKAPKIWLVCQHCDKPFWRWPSQLKRENRGRFCNLACQRKGTAEERKRFGPESGNWKGGSGTYRQRALKAFGARCRKCGYDKYPQLLWVHHKDFDHDTNHNLENLDVLCIRCHLEEHIEHDNAVQVEETSTLDVFPKTFDGEEMGTSYAEYQRPAGVGGQ